MRIRTIDGPLLPAEIAEHVARALSLHDVDYAATGCITRSDGTKTYVTETCSIREQASRSA